MQISYPRIAFAALLLGVLILVGGVLNLRPSQAAVGSVTLTVKSSTVPLGGRAVFTGSIPTGSTNTAFTSISIALAPASSQEIGLPAVTLRVDPTSGTTASGTTAVYKKFTSSGCATGTHTEGGTTYTLTCTGTDAISSGSITGTGYVFVKINPYLEGFQAGTLPGGTLPSAISGTLPAGQESTSKIDYVITWKPDISKSPAPPALAASITAAGDQLIAGALLGDTKGTQQTTTMGGPPNFPDFGYTGNAMCPPGADMNCMAQALDMSQGTLYIVLDGQPGQNDVIATFMVMGQNIMFQGSFQPMSPMDTADNWVDFSEITGIARLGGGGKFVLSGGATDASSFIAVVSGDGMVQEANGNSANGKVIKVQDLGTAGTDAQIDAPAGGLAAEEAGGGVWNLYLSELETTTTNTAVIVKLTSAGQSGDNFVFSKSLEVTLTGNPGFSAIGFDAVNNTLIGSSPDTSNSTNLIQVIDTGTTVFADNSGYVSQSNAPTEDGYGMIEGGTGIVTGLGTQTDNKGTNMDTSDDTTNAIIITDNYKDIYFSQMTGAQEAVTAGSGFFNLVHCVTKDVITDNVYVCLEGRGGSGKGGGVKVFERVGANYALKSSDNQIGGSGEFSEKVEGGVYVEGKGLYVVDNQYGPNSGGPTIVLINTTDDFGNHDAWYGMPGFIGELGGLSYEESSSKLVAISKNQSQFFKFTAFADSDDEQDVYPIDTKGLTQSNMMSQFWPEMGYNGIHSTTYQGSAVILLVRYDQVQRVSPSTGAIEGGWWVGQNLGGDFGGIGTQNLIGTFGNWPGAVGTVRIASLPGETPPEATIAETYSNTFTVVDSGGTNTASTTVDFVKLSASADLGLVVTSPVPGTAFTTSELVAGQIPIAGTVADPTISSITFGASLAKGTIVGSPVASPTGVLDLETEADHALVVTTQDDSKWFASGYWHVTNEFNTSGGAPFADDFGFYFGRDPDSATSSTTYTYGPEGTVSSGGLVTPQFVVGEETELTFKTWWETEPGLDWDKKLVQWCPGATWAAAQGACQTVLQITDQKQESMGGMMGGMMGPMMGPMMGGMMDMMGGMMGGMMQQSFTSPGTIFSLSPMGKNWDAVFVPGGFDEGDGPALTSVSVIFDELLPGNIGTTGYIRFFFNTGDGWGNEMRGWYVDDVHIEGAKSAAGQSFAVSYSDTTGLYSFTGALDANEGENVMTLTASRLGSVYNDGSGTISQAVEVSVFLDTTPPTVGMYAPEMSTITVGTSTIYVTNSSSFTVSGSFDENTPSALTVNQKTLTSKPSSGNLDFSAVAAKAAFSGKAADFVAAAGNYLAVDVNLQKSLGSSTLGAATLAGAVEIPVVSILNFEVGDVVKVDTVASREYRDVTAVSSADNTLTLSSGLSVAHASAVTVVEQPTIAVKDGTAFASAQYIAIGIGSKKEVRVITHIVSNTLALENPDDTTKHGLQIAHVSGEDCDTDDANCDTQVVGAEDVRWSVPSTSPIALVEGYNELSVVMTDKGGQDSTSDASIVVLLDTTAPTTAKAVAVTIVSDDEAVIGDSFFLAVAAVDDKSDVASVTLSSTSEALPGISNVENILMETYGLTTVTVGASTATTTHVLLKVVDSASFSVGDNSLTVTIQDTAGNSTTTTASLSVVSKRTNRNFLLFPGTNYVGLALIPDDGDSATTDDAKISRALTQTITAAISGDMQDDPAFSGGATLANIVTSVSAFSTEGNFVVYTPDASADTLTDLAPFQGMIFKVQETKAHSVTTSTSYDVFNKVSVTGFTATQAVPIKMNVQGVFFDPDSTPPSKTLRVGYNLVAPHILSATKFDIVYRGALIPTELTTSAIAFDRRITPVTNSDGSIGVEIFEGFTTQSIGDTLKPELAYWTFVVQDNATNPTTPTITP